MHQKYNQEVERFEKHDGIYEEVISGKKKVIFVEKYKV